MNKKTKGTLAGIAGAALLLGAGGTFALWSDTADVDGGAFRSGNLDVQADGPRWYDVSPDRDDAVDLNSELGAYLNWDADLLGEEQVVKGGVSTDFGSLDADGPGGKTTNVVGHPIDDLADWKTVPGDFLLGQTDVKANLEGDNIEAQLEIKGLGASGELPEGLGLKYFITYDHGAWDEEARDIDEPFRMHIMGGGDVEFTVNILANFPEGISGQDLVNAQAVLNDLTVELKQVR